MTKPRMIKDVEIEAMKARIEAQRRADLFILLGIVAVLLWLICGWILC